MYYNQFLKSISKEGVQESVRSYNKLIERYEDCILIGGEHTEFSTIEEARAYIKHQHYSENLQQELSNELYEDIPDIYVANIIIEHHNVKVTDTLIESYIKLASSKIFTVDPVVQEIRSLNKLDQLIEGKIHYELADGNVVAINESTQETLNNVLANKQEIIEYMRESKENFLSILEEIGE
jgi:hypothetical protein